MSKFNFEFQDFADRWSKDQVKRSMRLAKVFLKKGKKFKTTFVHHDWKGEFKNVGKMYYANKAVYSRADKNLPFATLVLLGEMLSDKAHKKTIQRIIDKNILTYDDFVYELNDPLSQIKIRKALRTYKFKETKNYTAQAA